MAACMSVHRQPAVVYSPRQLYLLMSLTGRAEVLVSPSVSSHAMHVAVAIGNKRKAPTHGLETCSMHSFYRLCQSIPKGHSHVCNVRIIKLFKMKINQLKPLLWSSFSMRRQPKERPAPNNLMVS